MKPELILWLIAILVVFLAAATASRTYVGTPTIWMLILAMALYTVGNLMMLKLMRESGLGIAISLSTIGQLVFINLIAVIGFGERPRAAQLAGVALGIVAMTLILWPSGRSS